ncbi:MAG: T9SS type A sorting domain-containing protein [Saprospiraceae bacterium]|nr:T9SS type A sorting domain-containing protein [Saprospiraceae bacterium]
MKLSLAGLTGLLALFAATAFGQDAKRAVVALTTSVNANTPSVTLTWPNPQPAYFVLYRRDKDSPDWFILLEADNSTTTTFTDTQVSIGQTYEYGIRRDAGNINAFGYALVPVAAPVVDNRGDLSVFVEAAITAPLAMELERLRLDLVGDGWDVAWHIVPTTGTVASIKSQIEADYAANGTSSVFLFGDLPVPYSGNSDWDGHNEHRGAWPADSYYGDVNSGEWTDVTVNTNNNPLPPDRPQTSNFPGDGKFDQDLVPTESEIAVGRVDFSNLSTSTFGISTVEMYRRYLNKNHNWRTRQYTVDNKVLVDDNFGYFFGEAFAANGYRNGNPLVGPSNVIDGDFFNDTDDNSFLFAYGCGPGTYTSAGGVGSSSQFGTDTVNAVFTQLFGSYHGDWDYSPDPFMVSALASKGGVLTCSWAGRPHWFSHHLGGGETMGYCALQTMNACGNIGYFSIFGDCGTHIALMGDPTVRAHNVQPVPSGSVNFSQACNTVTVTWQPSPQANVIGYHVYRSNQPNGDFTRLSGDIVTGTSFVDGAPIVGNISYMVKAVVNEITPSGIYHNTSIGTIKTQTVASVAPPTVNLPSSVQLSCTNPVYNINTCGAGLSCVINGPGVIGGVPPLALTQLGIYTVTVTDLATSCTATATITITQDNSIPAAPTATVGAVNCQAQTVQLSGSSTIQGASYLWTGPNGFTSTLQNPVVSQGGLYTLTITNPGNGCSNSTSVNVPSPQVPNASATGGGINCAATNVQLQGNSTTQNVTYSWAGPNGFTSVLQNPTVSVAGNYVLTVTSSSNCTASSTAVVAVQNNVPQVAPTVGGQLTCAIPQITINANPNQSGYNFAWTGPAGFTSTAQNPSVSVAGNYSVQVTDPLSGCISSANTIVGQDITQPTDVSAELGSVDCSAQTIVLLGDANEANLNYAWTGPGGFTAMEQNPTVSQAGTYTLTVQNSENGCVASDMVTVSNLALPTATAAGGVLTCATSSVELQSNQTTGGGGGGGNSFEWSGPSGFTSTDPTPTVSVVGEYVLTVTTALGCTVSATAIVSQSGDFPVAMPTASGILSCVNGQVTVNANPNQSGYGFVWTGPGGFTSDAQNPTVTLAGLYFVQITNLQTGCAATYSVQVTQFQLPDVDLLPDVSEINCTNPTIELDLTGICGLPGITCTLNGQPVSQQTSISQAGNYTLVVSQPLTGCSTTESFSIVGNEAAPNLSVNGDLTLNCDSDLTALTALSSTQGVSFLWTGLGANATQIVSAGTYTVVATAPNGCSTSESVTVTAPPALSISIAFTAPCDGNYDINVFAIGGTSPYNYQIIPEGPLPPNTPYSVIVVDGNGCMETISGTVPSAPPTLVVTAIQTNETVIGLNNGSATAQASGGLPPYTYQWSNGGNTATITNLAPGTYTCIITDSNGCTKTASATVLPGTNGTDELPGLRDLQLYPNPTSGEFDLFISLENPMNLQVKMMDVNGRILFKTSEEVVLEKTWRLDLTPWPSGVYYCMVAAGGKATMLKVVKMN